MSVYYSRITNLMGTFVGMSERLCTNLGLGTDFSEVMYAAARGMIVGASDCRFSCGFRLRA